MLKKLIEGGSKVELDIKMIPSLIEIMKSPETKLSALA